MRALGGDVIESSTMHEYSDGYSVEGVVDLVKVASYFNVSVPAARMRGCFVLLVVLY